MNDQKGQRLGVLKIDRVFDASIDEVFTAFTDPEIMSQWFYGFPKGSARVESDLRVGGAYRITMFSDDPSTVDAECKCGSAAPHYGEYLEISPPHRLVFTWKMDGFVDYSVVAIDFATSATGTRLTLTHPVPTKTIDPHRQGWNACLDNLEKFVA